MELKEYQVKVLETFAHYLDVLAEQQERVQKLEKLNQGNPDVDIPIPDFTEKTWELLRDKALLPPLRNSTPFSPRQDTTGRPVPNVCLKIPTGGGKTLLAAHAVSRIMGQWLQQNNGFVLWIVPNEAIYSQTIKTLRNREHPYRQILDRAAAGRVKILEKADRLDRRDVDSHLCVMLLMLQAANRESKESLKMFKDRGSVNGFFPVVDDLPAHLNILQQVPNLDIYGENPKNLGAIIKDSLGNALRIIQPVVIMDEGHKAYSHLAQKTLFGFNPSFILELSATPSDRLKAIPPVYSNWLVDVRGTDLDKEEMVKLPINVTVHGGQDWRDCLRKSYEHLNNLQVVADRLQQDSARYIRPICLIQVERTGEDQRTVGKIHADDVRDYLLTLGVKQEEIAKKTATENELDTPENRDLLSPNNQVRFIITKQALQEGWDCPFAYVLCSLAPVSSKGAMTQLVGRILRQPDASKTGVPPLDECSVFCHHASTSDVVKAIKNGLEKDGMNDLIDQVIDQGGGTTTTLVRKINRRNTFKGVTIYLPLVLWVGKETRPLDYEADILQRVRWGDVNLEEVIEKIPADPQKLATRKVQLRFTDNEFLDFRALGEEAVEQPFDAAYVTRAVADIIPNPWIAREYIDVVVQGLRSRGFNEKQLDAAQSHIVETLRAQLYREKNRLAEALFADDVQAGRIQFRLRTDGKNWKLPNHITTKLPLNASPLQRDDGKIVEHSLFDPAYKDDLNGYEQKVACYLDSEKTLRWWHRNVAKAQEGYALQGWKKNKIYPDFLFAMTGNGKKQSMFVLETKGDHLDNPDTAYKKKLLELCSKAYSIEKVEPIGQLELIDDDGTTVICSLIFEENWQTELRNLVNE